MQNANIIKFNEVQDKNVWVCISTFFSRIEQNSKNTRLTYERAVREFFELTRGKELEKLVESDLIFTKSEIERYQTRIKNKYKGTTVNNKMSALKKVYSKLEDNEFDVRASWFNVDRYSEHEKVGYDPMTFDEVLKSIELVSKTRKGTEKALLIEMAFTTGFRKESLKTITLNDIYNVNGVWVVEAIDKGNKKNKSKLSDDLYKRIVEFVESEKKQKNDAIFQLTNKTIRGMMDYIRDNIDFGRRNIVFHSLKKAGVEEVAIKSGYDLKAMQAQGNHANISTTLNHYMSNKSVEDMTLVDINYTPSVKEFEDMSKDELINMLKNAPRDIQLKLLKQEGLI